MISRRQLLRHGAMAAAGLLGGPAIRRTLAAAPDYDVCIIGSGFAGTYLGLRLAAGGVRTAIVEAGAKLSPTDDPGGATSLFPCAVRGGIGFPIDFNRTIAIGGTSRKWTGIVTRLLPSDFRTRSTFGLFADWPISYEDLEPYYCLAERDLHTVGSPAVDGAEPRRRCRYPVESAQDLIPPAAFGRHALAFFPLAFSRRNGQPVRLAEVETERFAGAPNGTLLSAAPATALVTHDGHTVAEVEIRRRGGAVERLRARHFVVAAGVVETARLLLGSRSTWFPDGLGNRRDLLGRGINAHPVYSSNLTPAAAQALRIAGDHRTYSFNDRLRREGYGSCHVDFHGGPSAAKLNLAVEMEPIPGNRVVLDDHVRDGFGRPQAALHMDWSALDRRTVRRGRALQRGLETALAGPDGIGARRVVWFHPAGGCAMGRDEAAAVVDADCRVFGLDNLYVAGAAVFPTSGSGNPTLTIVALSYRLADHLLSRIGRDPRAALHHRG
jgi:glucose dehydrogenase